MLYDKEVDKTIAKELYNNDTLGYNELYRYVCKSYRKIAKDSYNFHIQKLKVENILNNKEIQVGKIKKSYYFLTAEGKQKYRLQILNLKTEKEKAEFIIANEKDKRLITYLFLIYDYRVYYSNPNYILDLTEEELDIHLNKCKVSRNDLFVDESFAKGGIKNNKRERRTALKTITNIQVYKIEKFNKKGELQSILYNLNLPGFSIEQFIENLNRRGIEHTGFTNEEIENSLKNLINENIFKTIEIDGQYRYVIVDENLNLFLKNFLFLMKDILYKMDLAWIFVRRPLKEDVKWLELFIGIQDTKEKLNELRENRKRLKKNKTYAQQARDEIIRIEKIIDEFIKWNKNQFSDIIERYTFPCNEMLELIYPKHFQKVLIS